jgi:hypothetical protein
MDPMDRVIDSISHYPFLARRLRIMLKNSGVIPKYDAMYF